MARGTAPAQASVPDACPVSRVLQQWNQPCSTTAPFTRQGPSFRPAACLTRTAALGTGYRRGMGIEENAVDWVPQTCTLPTAERPLRVGEFDALFAAALRGVVRVGPTRLRLSLDGSDEVEATARELTARETECCSFFGFTLARRGDAVEVDVTVPVEHADVLTALAKRAATVVPGSVEGSGRSDQSGE